MREMCADEETIQTNEFARRHIFHIDLVYAQLAICVCARTMNVQALAYPKTIDVVVVALVESMRKAWTKLK